MSLEIVSEIWNFVKESMPSHDREHLAEHIVGLMIDNDYTVSDIKSAFPADKDIVSAMQIYSDDLDIGEDWEDESESYDDGDDDNYDNDY